MKFRRMFPLGALLLLSAMLFLSGRSIPEAPPAGSPGRQALDSLIVHFKRARLDSLMSRYHRDDFNGCVLIANRGERFYQHCHGYAHHEDSLTMDSTAVFQLASLSKPFTGMAILKLREQRKIDLTAPVSEYLHPFPYPDITVLHLLNHTSGIPDYINQSYAFSRYFPRKTRLSNVDLLDIMNAYRIPLRFRPGEKYSYSNTGYALLALIVESISGVAYEDFLDIHVFHALDMHNSFASRNIERDREERGIQKLVTPYKSDSYGPEKYYRYRDGVIGDKGVYSTITDLLKFDRALYGSRLLRFDIRDQAFEPTLTNDGNEIEYGLGWRVIQHDEAGKVVYHRGFWHTYNTCLMRFADHDVSLIILHNNTRDYSCSVLIEEIISILFVETQQYVEHLQGPNASGSPEPYQE